MLILLLLATAVTAAPLGAAEERTISTTGEALVQVVPDHVVVALGIETYRPTLDAARQANTADCARLLTAVKNLGVAERDIQTDVLNVDIDYKSDGRPSRGVEGYYVRRAYSITLNDTKRFEALVDTALNSGANKLMGFEFKTKELRKHRDAARLLAIKAAREKAQALAGALGMTAGAPRTIHEGSADYYGSYRSWWGWGYSGQASQNAISVQGSGESGGETLPLGHVAVRAQVIVSFALE
jgi:uncharacterized protein YggE